MMKTTFRLTTLVILATALLGSVGNPGQSLALPGGVIAVRALAAGRLKIPAIKVDLRIVTARFIGDTWDFNAITYQAAYLEGRPLPGSGGNVVIGAHSEL